MTVDAPPHPHAPPAEPASHPPARSPLPAEGDNGRPLGTAATAVTGPITASRLRVAEPADVLRFMFGVGIECSYPKIAEGLRVDQLRDTGHYELWRTDLRLVRELGLR